MRRYTRKPEALKDRSVDQSPLKGRDRSNWRDQCLAASGAKRSQMAVLRVLVDDFCFGKADCFPGVEKIAERAGVSETTARAATQWLDQADVIIAVVDKSVKTHRRYVIASHPNARKVVAELLQSPFVEADNPGLRGRFQGLWEDAPRGVISVAPRGSEIDAPRGSVFTPKAISTPPGYGNQKSLESVSLGFSASFFVKGFSHEDQGNGEALHPGLNEEAFESWLRGQAEFDGSLPEPEHNEPHDVHSGPRSDDRALELSDRPKLPAEALAAIREHTPDLLEEAQLEARRILEAVQEHTSVIGSAAWEIRQARFAGRRVREPIELFISKCRRLAAAKELEGTPAPQFPDLSAFQVVDGPHSNAEADLRRCWAFVWDSWHEERLCKEFLKYNRRLPTAWWMEAIQEARLSAGTVGSMYFVMTIAKSYLELGSPRERAERMKSTELEPRWKATLKKRGIEHAPAYPWQKSIVEQSKGNRGSSGAV